MASLAVQSPPTESTRGSATPTAPALLDTPILTATNQIQTKIDPKVQIVVEVINERSGAVKPGHVEEVLAQFPEKQRATAAAVLKETASAGNPENMNGVMKRMQELGVEKGGTKIIDLGPGSVTDNLQYLHNKALLPDFEHIPPTALADKGKNLRVVGEHFYEASKYNEHEPSPGKAVLVLDKAALDRFNSSPQGIVQLETMLTDPNVKVIVPVGKDFGVSGLTFDQKASVAIIKPIVETAQKWIQEGYDPKTATHEAMIQLDPVLSRLRAMEPDLVKRVELVHADYQGANAKPTVQVTPTPENIAMTLNGRQTELHPEKVQALLDKAPPAMHDPILNALEMQATPVSYKKLGDTLRSMSEVIHSMTRGKKVFYVVSEEGKSFGLIADMMRNVDPSITPDRIVTPNQLGGRLGNAHNEWKKNVREWGDMSESARAQHPEKNPGTAPNPKVNVAVVILDDMSGSGGSLGKAVDRVRAGSITIDTQQKSIKFEGQVIVAPVVMVDGAEKAILHNTTTNKPRDATIIAGIKVPSLEKILSTSENPRSVLDAHGGVGNLGHADSGTVITLPYSGPNNNSLLGNWFAKSTLPSTVVKPPSEAKNRDYQGFLASRPWEAADSAGTGTNGR